MDQREHFVEALKKFHTAMLMTHQDGDRFHARPMALAEVEDSGRLWFFTAADAPKVREIEQDAEVAITAQDGDSLFIALSGRATLIGDREKIAHLWKEPFRAWFPDGPDDPNIELISVRPTSGEYWDNTGLNRYRYLWDAAKAYVSGTTPEVDEPQVHGSVKM